MTPDAVLKVQVKVDGMAATLAQIKALDSDLQKAGRSADQAAGGFSGAGRDAKKMATEVSQAARAAKGMAGDAEKAAKSVRGLGDDTDRTSRRFGGFRGALSAAGGGIGGLLGGIASLGGGFGRLGGSIAGALPLLLALGGATFAVVAALGPLIGLLGAAAVGFTALAQGAGVALLAFAGIGGALKEQSAAHGATAKAAQSASSQQASAAKAIASAQDGVRAAHEHVRSATEALSRAEGTRAQALKALGPAQQQATRDLENMHAALTNAALTERGAVVSLAEARQRLGQALRPVDAQQLADAQSNLTTSTLSEQRAVLGLADARKRLADLMKPADALTMADANDAVADAVRGQEQATLNVQKAQQAYDRVMNDPKASDTDRAQAKLDLADATNAVDDSTRSLTRAQQQLDKLKAGPDPAEVAKATLDVADAQQAVADASRNTAKAQKDVQDAQKGANPAQVAKAQLEVLQAIQALADATRERLRLQKDSAAADRAGVSGSAVVVAAHRDIADATRSVADAERGLAEAHRAVTKAQAGVVDAQNAAKTSMAGAAAAAVDLNAKFNALPPAAQKFVKVLLALKPKLDDLRATAAAGLFPGVIAGMHAAMGSFDSVKKVTGETATVLGGLAQRAGELVGSGAFGKDLETIGHRNAIVIDRLGRAGIYLGDALRHVLVAAGPLTTWLAKVTVEWAKSVDASAQAGRESGKLEGFFQKTKDTLKTVASIIGNVAHAFLGMGKAAAPSGRSILKSLDAVSARFDKWANSVGGQHALQDFFKQSKDLAGKLMPALGGVLGSLGSLAFRVMPAYIAILNALGPLAGPLVQAFVIYKLALTGVAIATNLVTAATKLWAAGQWLLNAALTANPIGLVVLAIAALVAGLIIAYKKSETFRDIVNGMFGALSDGFGWVKDHWPLLLAILTGPIGLAVLAIGTHIDDIVDFFKKLPGRIVSAIKAGASGIVDAGKWVINRIVDGITAMASAIAGAAGWVKNRIVEGIQALAGGFVAVGSWIINRVVDGVTTITAALGAVGGWIKNRIVEFIHAAVEGFTSVGGWVLNRVVDGITVVSEGLKAVGGWLKNRIMDLVDSAKDGFMSVGGKIIGFIVSGLEGGANKLVDFLNKIIHVINKIPGVDIPDIKGFAEGGINQATHAAQGLAKGGAFARTGGIVSSPITLMGEEAPSHPEFVIPTNPAYRGRAQALLGQAAGAIGLAKGGIFGGIGSIAGSLGGIVGDLFSGGAKFLTGKLPSADKLPEPFKGTGKWLLGKAGGFIEDKVKGILDGILGSGSSNGGPVPGGERLGRMLAQAGAMDAQGTDYLYGGGHSSFAGPWDCSGAVSAVLHAAGLLDSPISTDGLKVFGEAGDGKVVTIGVRGSTGRNAHTMIKLGNRYFESGSGHGAKWVSGWSGDFPIHRHPAGMAKGGVFGAAGNKMPPWGWGLAKGGMFGGLPYAGAFGGGGTVPGPLGAPAHAIVHGGETISNGSGGGPQVIHEHHYHGPVVQDREFLAYLRRAEQQHVRRNGKSAFGGN